MSRTRSSAQAANTQRAYASDLRDFSAWCAERGRPACPAAPDDVAAYLRDRAEHLAPATIARRLAAIVAAHHRLGLDSPRDHPRVRNALASIEWHHRARRRPTRPLDAESLARLSLCLPATVRGTRDRALLLLGYGAALRRTELVSLDVRDVVVAEDGALRITSERGRVVIPPGSQPHLCAVRAWNAWTASTGLGDGPAFRAIDRHGHVSATRLSDRAVTIVVRRAATGAGLDPDAYSGRSLRLGMILSAAAVGASDEHIMHHTGHRSRRLVRAYRDA
ncbi:MAG TPA: site-specific integrase [Acidimicrobiia bacterium]|nr:site-specific integrase [Acidimicrobiia bacterium]